MNEAPSSVKKYIAKMEKMGKKFSRYSVVPDRWNHEKIKRPIIDSVKNIDTAFELKHKLSPIYGLMQVVGNSALDDLPTYLIESIDREKEWDYPFKSPHLLLI